MYILSQLFNIQTVSKSGFIKSKSLRITKSAFFQEDKSKAGRKSIWQALKLAVIDEKTIKWKWIKVMKNERRPGVKQSPRPLRFGAVRARSPVAVIECCYNVCSNDVWSKKTQGVIYQQVCDHSAKNLIKITLLWWTIAVNIFFKCLTLPSFVHVHFIGCVPM